MNRTTISALIADSVPELKARGLAALYLFGSRGRGTEGAQSDIDFAFDLTDDADARFSIIDQASIQNRLEEIFGHKVDFFERRALRRRFGSGIDDDMVKLF